MGLEGDAKDILVNAQAVYTFEPDNSEDLEQQIKKMMLLSNEEIEKMGQLAKAYYINNLSMESSVDKLERNLKNIINN